MQAKSAVKTFYIQVCLAAGFAQMLLALSTARASSPKARTESGAQPFISSSQCDGLRRRGETLLVDVDLTHQKIKVLDPRGRDLSLAEQRNGRQKSEDFLISSGRGTGTLTVWRSPREISGPEAEKQGPPRPPFCATTPTTAETRGMSKRPNAPALVKAKDAFLDYRSNGFETDMPCAIRLFPQDPSKRGFFIHGVDEREYWKLGTPASAGCVRLRKETACRLYETIKACGSLKILVKGEAPKEVYTASSVEGVGEKYSRGSCGAENNQRIRDYIGRCRTWEASERPMTTSGDNISLSQWHGYLGGCCQAAIQWNNARNAGDPTAPREFEGCRSIRQWVASRGTGTELDTKRKLASTNRRGQIR